MLEERIATIVEHLEKQGSVTVRQLAAEFGVTEKTVRHDLAQMERRGLLRRVHGGAVSTVRVAEDAYANSGRKVALASKELIARAAYDYVRAQGMAGSVYFIDAGTTTYEFARCLTNSSSIVITNDLLIASRLSTSDVLLHLTGGRVFNNVNKYLVGPDAVEMIGRHSASVCFVGASSIGLTSGLMTQNNEDVDVKRAMMAHSGTVVCLADHTKFHTTSFVRFAEVGEVDVIITDEADEALVASYAERGVRVVVAGAGPGVV